MLTGLHVPDDNLLHAGCGMFTYTLTLIQHSKSTHPLPRLPQNVLITNSKLFRKQNFLRTSQFVLLQPGGWHFFPKFSKVTNIWTFKKNNRTL